MIDMAVISSVGGVLSGFIGSIVTSVTNYKLKKLELEDQKARRLHDIALLDAETKAMIAETEANIQIVKTQVDGAVELSEAEAFRESQVESAKGLFAESYMDKLSGMRWIGGPVVAIVAMSFAFIDVLKGSIRPTVTIYLMAIVSYISYLAYQMTQAMDQSGLVFENLAVDLLTTVVYTVLYLTVTVISWWFSDRRVAKFMGKFLSSKIA